MFDTDEDKYSPNKKKELPLRISTSSIALIRHAKNHSGNLHLCLPLLLLYHCPMKVSSSWYYIILELFLVKSLTKFDLFDM